MHEIVQTGLTGYWHHKEGIFPNTWTNIAPNATTSNIELFGAMNTSEGLKFDGVDDYGYLRDGFQLGDGSFTVEMRLRYNVVYNYKTLLQMDAMNLLASSPIWVIDGRGLQSRAEYDTSTFYNYCMTFDAETSMLKLYVNGVEISFTDRPINPFVWNNYPVYIGQSSYGVGSNFDGVLSYIRLYDRALSESEVVQNNEVNGIGLPTDIEETYNCSVNIYQNNEYHYDLKNSIFRDVLTQNDIRNIIYEHILNSLDVQASLYDTHSQHFQTEQIQFKESDELLRMSQVMFNETKVTSQIKQLVFNNTLSSNKILSSIYQHEVSNNLFKQKMFLHIEILNDLRIDTSKIILNDIQTLMNIYDDVSNDHNLAQRLYNISHLSTDTRQVISQEIVINHDVKIDIFKLVKDEMFMLQEVYNQFLKEISTLNEIISHYENNITLNQDVYNTVGEQLPLNQEFFKLISKQIDTLQYIRVELSKYREIINFTMTINPVNHHTLNINTKNNYSVNITPKKEYTVLL